MPFIQCGTWFQPEEYPIASLQDMAEVLERISRDSRALVVRGGLAPWVHDEMADLNRPIQRRKVKKGGIEPGLVEVKCPWLMVDIDSFPLRPSDDLADDPESAIEYAIAELLPKEFHDAEALWQLSSSAGFTPGVLKAHVIFWLTEPADNKHIKEVLKQHAPGVDRALFNAAQPHYIAAPVIEGRPDPLPRRTGWRKGIDAAVTLPPLRAENPSQRKQRSSDCVGRSIEDALALLGDGDGQLGFHEPLRTAIMRYAKRCNFCGTRDDNSFREMLRAAIRSAPRRPGRFSIDNYLSDDYLQRSITGAFARLTGNTDIQTMQPLYPAATGSIETVREMLGGHIADYLERVRRWHAAPVEGRDDPEHAALATSLGTGKSSLGRAALPLFIAGQKAAELPHRVLWAVQTHRLGHEARQAMADIGLSVAVFRGREADDPDADQRDTKMCLAPDAVQDALAIGEDIERSVCGDPTGPCCPFYQTCGYQRQKSEVALADVVIVAHTAMFHQLPDIVTKRVAITIMDEAWWRIGLEPGREINLPGFLDDLFKHPVLRNPDVIRGIDGKAKRTPKGMQKRQVGDEPATSVLHEYTTKVQRAFEETSEGDFVSRESVERTGLTAEDCSRARQLEWRRKRTDVLSPNMTSDARKQAVKRAAVNATLSRRAGVWRALEDLLSGTETHSGRLEIGRRTDASGSSRVILLHSRRDLCRTVTDGPILMLDATMPFKIVRYYLPRLVVLAELQAATPHLDAFLVLGPWGKTSIIPDPKAGEEENQTRDRHLAELRDFVVFHSGGNALVVTYKAIEDRFIGLPGIRTGHFNAIAGLDIFGDVRSLFVIGRPLPEPDALWHLALALTGKFIAYENPEVETLEQRMADGSGVAIKVRKYADPDLEAVRLAITDAEVLQAAGRGRAVNRTAETPLTMFIMADVVVPMPVRRIARWADMRLSAHQRMAARGLVSDSPTDAARLYPDLFPSAEAAKKALQRVISGTFPYEENLIGKCPRNRVIEGRYRPQGRGQQLRLIAVAEWRLPQARDDLEAILGPLGVFELAPTPAIDGTTPRSSQAAETPAITLPDPIALAVMADVDKLTIRAHLQASCAPLSPDAAASELLGGYGEGSPPGELLRGWRITAPKASSWKIWRRTQGPLTAEELSDDPLIIMLMEPQATSTAV